VREGKSVKAYGAGLLSSFGELDYACNPPTQTKRLLIDLELNLSPNSNSIPSPLLLPWDPTVASQTLYPITTYQPAYFVAERLGLGVGLRIRLG
jgi:phenylalanine-4-hydroxylase